MKKISLAELLSIQDRASRLFGDVAPADPERSSLCGIWSPAVDIYETETEFVVTAETPEVTRTDIDIRILNNTLVIEGERKPRRKILEGYHRIERAYGKFQRSFLLPGSIEQDNIKASLRDGILNIILPKKKEAVHKQVAITAA